MNKLILNKLYVFSALLLIFNSLSSQDFAWIKGVNTINQAGEYGTVGVPDPTNNPGAREGAATWKDAAGNFWIFGGTGYDDNGNYGDLSDLWKYTVSTNQWVFLKGNNIIAQAPVYTTLGSATPFGKPGGRRSSATWTDAAGHLWLLGGYGLSGGFGIGYLNDLWKYDITTNEWTYVNGSSMSYQPGNYGTMGTPSATTSPGGRMGPTSWSDNAGDLWLIGGYGNTTTSTTIGAMNDVWRYNVTNNTWTWVNGSNLIDQNGMYGTLGTPSATNTPGSRFSSTGWKDGAGNFWLLGGNGWDATNNSNSGLLNDLWKYNMSTNEWTWMKGMNTLNQQGIYGLQGSSNTANNPGSRAGSLSWRDGVGNLWLFGGNGYPGSSAVAGGLNDLWKFSIATNEWTWIRGTSLVDQHGIYGSLGLSAFPNLPGARTTHAGWMDASNDLYLFGGYGQAASGVTGNLSDLWKYTNCYISPITMTVISQDSSICAGESTSLTVTGSTNYLWLHNLSLATFVVIKPSVTTTYSVITADSKGCRYTAAFTQTVSQCTGILAHEVNTASFQLYPNPGNGILTVRLPTINDKTSLIIYNALGQQVFAQQLTEEVSTLKTNLSKGIYVYKLLNTDQNGSSGKLIIE